jgi:hypothetical protein
MARKITYKNLFPRVHSEGTSFAVPRIAIELAKRFSDVQSHSDELISAIRLLKKYEGLKDINVSLGPEPSFIFAEPNISLLRSISEVQLSLSVGTNDLKKVISASFESISTKEWSTHEVDHLAFATPGRKKKIYQRIIEKQNEVNMLRQRLKVEFSSQLLTEIRRLVQQLHSFVHSFVLKHTTYLKGICRVKIYKNLTGIGASIARPFLPFFKLLPDFSGCDEDAKFTNLLSKPQLFIQQLIKKCIIKHFYWNHWTHYWNRPTINSITKNLMCFHQSETTSKKTTTMTNWKNNSLHL